MSDADDTRLMGEWLTVDGAAAALGLSPHSIRDAIRADRLPARKVSRVWFISPAALEEYRREHLGGQGWEKRRAPGYEPDPKRQARRERLKARREQPATPPADEE